MMRSVEEEVTRNTHAPPLPLRAEVMTLCRPCQTDRHAGAWGVSRSRVIPSCGHGLGNDVPLLLLGLIPHIVRGIGLLNVLMARLREPQETVGARTPLMGHRSAWEHVQVVHVEP